MTLQIDNLPLPALDALERRARDEGRTLQEVAIDALVRGLESQAQNPVKRDLTGISGTMTAEDAQVIEDSVKWTDEGDLAKRT